MWEREEGNNMQQMAGGGGGGGGSNLGTLQEGHIFCVWGAGSATGVLDAPHNVDFNCIHNCLKKSKI